MAEMKQKKKEEKKKGGFLACPCHDIYREETVGLNSSNNIPLKLRFLWICEIWSNFVKIYILSITALFEFESKTSFAHMW